MQLVLVLLEKHHILSRAPFGIASQWFLLKLNGSCTKTIAAITNGKYFRANKQQKLEDKFYMKLNKNGKDQKLKYII